MYQLANCVVMRNLHNTWQLCISSDKQQVSNISLNEYLTVRTPFFWDVILHHWVISSQHFKGIQCLHFQGSKRFQGSIRICVTAYKRVVFIPVNLLKPTGYVMHRQFNIQQLYALPTLYLCVLYLSENKQQLVPLTP